MDTTTRGPGATSTIQASNSAKPQSSLLILHVPMPGARSPPQTRRSARCRTCKANPTKAFEYLKPQSTVFCGAPGLTAQSGVDLCIPLFFLGFRLPGRHFSKRA